MKDSIRVKNQSEVNLLRFFSCNTVKPIRIRTMPITIMIKPLLVHSGLSYINEVDGPTTELLCIVNIMPAATRIIPTMIGYFPYPL